MLYISLILNINYHIHEIAIGEKMAIIGRKLFEEVDKPTGFKIVSESRRDRDRSKGGLEK